MCVEYLSWRTQNNCCPPICALCGGVIDCGDLPLNVSREILQNDKKIEAIRSGCTRRILSQLGKIADEDQEKYAKFWGEFGRVMKEGIIEDAKNREDIAKLLRYCSTQSSDDAPKVSLSAYVSRMQKEQESIYYITASNLATARNSPHLEIFAQKGIEVLCLTDEVDEWVVSHLPEFDGKPLKSITKGELDLKTLDEEEIKEEKEGQEQYKDLIQRIKEALGERVKEVRITHRLTASPACLVADEHAMSAHLERILSAAGQQVTGSQPILEINPAHPLVQRMQAEDEGIAFADWAHILHDQALLSEGGKLEDPANFVHRLNQIFETLSRSQ